DFIFIGLIIIILVILLKPLVIDGLSPQGVDVLSSIGAHHLMNEYTHETGERSLWNPAIFAGMPRYHRYGPVAFSVDNILNILGRYASNVFMYYLFGALGLYFLLRYLKVNPAMSFIGALAFILMPHYKSLYVTGHYSKLRAIMILPWVVLGFQYFLNQRTILSAALFALAFGLQIRTQHYQIVFYTGLFIFTLGIYPLLKDLFEKEYVKVTKSTLLIFAGVILAILMAAQPLFLSKEYLPYSKRGKTTIDVNKNAQDRENAQTGGVSMQYATQWSTYPSEIFTWLVPRFYGGTSSETYQGELVAQARNKPIQVSTYWGHMPFTQSYEYMGVIIFILAVIGIFANRKNPFILSLAIFAVFLTLLSFGRHFQVFYGLFYDYFPFFNKFRAPMMSVTITFFIVIVLAILGLKYIKTLNKDKITFQEIKPVIVILGSFFALGIIFLIYGQMASFVKPSGEQYQGQVLEIIKTIREHFFTMDVLRYLLLVIVTGGLIYAYLKKKIVYTVFVALIGLAVFLDLYLVQTRISGDFSDKGRLEKRYFKETAVDKILFKDNELFRIFPVGKDLSGYNRWAYYHQIINGYTPIKMYTIEELVENNIFNGWDKNLPINWNVLKILNVKYIIMPQQVQSEHLDTIYEDKDAGLWLYLYKDNLPRAYFVGVTK
ncbi:MAG: 6-pyruvoyl-tetrahydropterin synthase-related protein, partial [Calditrichaceae bacterium]